MKLLKTLAFSLLLIVLVGSSACGSGQQANTQNQTAIAKGDLTVKVNSTGKASYATDAKLAFDTTGKVELLTVKKEDKVTKGAVLAKLDTGDLELALSQAKVAVAQAQKALTQAKIAVTQAQVALTHAQSAKTQAEAAVTTAQFNLDQIQAVGDIKDKIMDIEIAISTAKENRRIASGTGDSSSLSYYNQHLIDLNNELDKKNTDLQKLLAKDEYNGVATYEIMTYDAVSQTYTLGGETYNRLVVEDIQIKQKQLEIARIRITEADQNIEQANQNILLDNQTVEQSQLSLEHANQAVAVAQDQLANATILAPFIGVIATLNLQLGDYIVTPGLSMGTPIYMVDPTSLEISTKVDEIDIAGVQIGQKSVISLEALPDQKFDGMVTKISTIPVTSTSTSGVVEYEVTIGFNGAPPSQIKSGMTANVDIVTVEKNGVVLVPNKFIKQHTQGQKTVDVLVNQKTQEQAVVLGLTDGTQTEVISGINEGDIVINYP